MSSITDLGADKPATQKSTADLVNDLTSQFSHLARTEIRLAVREVQHKAKHAGIGAAGFGVAGVLALYGLGVVLAGLVLLLAMALPAWVAAMIVAGAVFVLAGIAALVGRRQLRKGSPMPSDAVDSAKEDVHVVKEAAKR
ncbi:MAG TPA: phage holin family protein [Actinophytocola sp.]|nr:phage holin family protein [Actinophytocola sp.]